MTAQGKLTPYNNLVIMAAMGEQPQWRIEFYQDPQGRRPVEEWLLGLDPKDRARVRRAFGLLEAYGLQLGMPYARHLRGKLWELRITSGRRDYRALYAAVVGRRFVLLHGFSKKGPKTPARDLESAERRLADYQASRQEED
jgi:phage-related protein